MSQRCFNKYQILLYIIFLLRPKGFQMDQTFVYETKSYQNIHSHAINMINQYILTSTINQNYLYTNVIALRINLPNPVKIVQ